jgi:hypothetical protein
MLFKISRFTFLARNVNLEIVRLEENFGKLEIFVDNLEVFFALWGETNLENFFLEILSLNLFSHPVHVYLHTPHGIFFLDYDQPFGVTSNRGTVHVFKMKQHHPHLTSAFGRILTPSEIDYQTNNSSPSKEVQKKSSNAFASLSKLTHAFALGESDPSYAQV